MKTIFLLVTTVILWSSCTNQSEVQPTSGIAQKKFSGARPIGSTPGIESWGGITLTRVPVTGTLLYYEANWCGVPLRFDKDFSYMNGIPNGQPAYSDIINSADLASMDVSYSQPELGTTGFFQLYQLNTGPSGTYVDSPKRQAILSVEEAVAGVYAQAGYYFGSQQSGGLTLGGMKDALVDAIKDLKNSKDTSDPAQAQEIENIKDNVANDKPANSSVQSDTYSYTITGRLVVKPGSTITFGIVPLGWVAPVYPEP